MSRLFSTTVDLDNWEFPDKERPATKLACDIIPLLKGYSIPQLREAVRNIEIMLVENSFIDYQD
jgi:hypothetical protein